ncbi:TNT domain-containing protein [Microbacterium sp. NPDC057407]|uniref:TNT domain-containing protein n=1 Tax=Microbacterium sp. NPDC057407 TaxID=3346120 RepID=UPI00366DC7BC
MPSAIDPTQIPGKDIDPDAIDAHAATIRTIGGQVRDNGSDVHLKWQGMAGVYEAPESGTLLGLMQPVSTQATTAGDNLEVVSGALTRFASDVRPIKVELDSLRLQAESFRAEIDGGVSVRELNPAYVNTQTYQGSWNAYGAAGTDASASDIPQYRTVTKEWHEVQEYVDRNNELLSQVNAQQVALWEAERTCANAIRALFGGAPLRAYESENDPLGYGLGEIPEGTEMPWGAPVERTEGCGEATVNFVVKDFLWEGIVVGGIWGTIEGLGTLVLGYNPATGDWFSGDAYGAAWGNLGLLAASGVMNSPVLAPILLADQGMEAFGGGGFLPQEVRDFKAQADEAAINTGKALIAWDKWADDPGTALGESVFNVGTILIPGGAAVAGVKTAGTAASVLSKMARVVDLVDPAALALNGTVRLGGLGLGSLDNLIGNLDLGSKLDAPNIEVYTATDAASALDTLDGWGVDLNSVTARVDDGVPVLEFPGGRVELPPGSFDNLGGVRGGDGGADASVTAPVREPELIAAGGVRGETGPGAANAVVDEAPVRTETGRSGDGGADASGTAPVRDPEITTGGSGGSGGDGVSGHGGSGRLGDGDSGAESSGDSTSGGAGEFGHGNGSGHSGGTGEGDGPTGADEPAPATVAERIAAGTDPVHSASSGVPGEWQRVADDPLTPKDLHYGEPMSAHGTSTYPANPGGHTGFALVDDPAAPYGRDASGAPLTQADYDSRYVFAGNNWDNYPPNAGAVRGSRVQYTDIDAFVRDYGVSLDRIGPPSGDYLGLRPDGVPATFEQRGLPVSSLKKQVFNCELTGYLPDNWSIEISEIAPAFGQPGGGLQLLIRDAAGNKLPVSTLDAAGVLKVDRSVTP